MTALVFLPVAALVALMFVPMESMPEWARVGRHARRRARGEARGW